MKKTLSILLCGVMILGFVSCSKEINKTNEWGKAGANFREYLQSFYGKKDWNTLRTLDYTDTVRTYLDLLSFNAPLRLYLATDNDNSWFYISDTIVGKYNYEQHEKVRTSLPQHIECEPSEKAAWQIFLLYDALSQLPYDWHGEYLISINIFNTEDLTTIRGFTPKDTKEIKQVLRNIEKQEDVLPQVKMISTTQAQLTYCYWSDWTGLIRCTYIVDFEAKTVKYSNSTALYKYDCGLLL